MTIPKPVLNPANVFLYNGLLSVISVSSAKTLLFTDPDDVAVGEKEG